MSISSIETVTNEKYLMVNVIIIMKEECYIKVSKEDCSIFIVGIEMENILKCILSLVMVQV